VSLLRPRYHEDNTSVNNQVNSYADKFVISLVDDFGGFVVYVRL